MCIRDRFGEARVTMDQTLIQIELARRVGVEHAARRTVIQRCAVVELGGALAVTTCLGLLGEFLLLFGRAHPLLDDGRRVLDAFRGPAHIGGPKALSLIHISEPTRPYS